MLETCYFGRISGRRDFHRDLHHLQKLGIIALEHYIHKTQNGLIFQLQLIIILLPWSLILYNKFYSDITKLKSDLNPLPLSTLASPTVIRP